ncbi:hypothetical protein [Halolamina pelagica]|uniref:hypothetical protein n=1 Tax=Halolamina pelagica TaxID=699431 RepID=UPI0009B5C751|nr:hypothetical protein [Halolamina pelagica]
MKSIVLMLTSVSVALFVGFSVSFVVSPDPTGVLPMAMGVVLTAILSAIFYIGSQQILASTESPA